MAWIYILIRTFPFWAIPTSLFLFAGMIRRKSRPRGKALAFYLSLAITLFVGSLAFLWKSGQFTAVPFVHELLTGNGSPR